MVLLVCDTDFLMKVAVKPLPELASFLANPDFEIVTIPRIEDELKGLSLSRTPSTARKAKTALSLLRNSVKIVKQIPLSEKADADRLLIHFAESSNEEVAIATLDGSLLSALERKQLSYLTLRNDRPFFRTFSSATYLLDKVRK
jgi:rRNA-processing protein FCF1